MSEVYKLFTVERCGGECVVGGVYFAGAYSRRTLLG